MIVSSNEGLRPIIREDFTSIEELGYLEIPIGPTRVRKLKVFLASGYRPAERTAEFEASFAGKREP
jgi:hypothetical protein